MGALSQNLFTMIVAMAVVTTMAMPPMLRWGLARVPMSKEEKERLEREEFEAKGFVSNLERLLLAVDDSPNGKFAARLAGLIAGPRGMPTTVLPLEKPAKPKKMTVKNGDQADEAPEPLRSSDVVRAAAESSRNVDDDDTSAVTITVRAHDKPTEEAVATEAKKGYDLLFVGIKNTRTKSGGFSANISRIATAFEGPIALVAGRDQHLEDPQLCPQNILLPIAGTDVSRRAAEVAIAIARACACPITAIYVANAGTGKRRAQVFRARERDQAIVKEIVTMADRYDVEVKALMHADVAPDKAIVAEAKKSKQDLIVMGVNRRPGESLFFGDTAAAVFEQAPASIVFVAT